MLTENQEVMTRITKIKTLIQHHYNDAFDNLVNEFCFKLLTKDSLSYPKIENISFSTCIDEEGVYYSAMITYSFLKKISNEEKPLTKEEDNFSSAVIEVTNKAKNKWDIFLEKLEILGNPILTNIIKGSRIHSLDIGNKVMNIELSNDSEFFKTFLRDRKHLWAPIFKEVYGEVWELEIL